MFLLFHTLVFAASFNDYECTISLNSTYLQNKCKKTEQEYSLLQNKQDFN